MTNVELITAEQAENTGRYSEGAFVLEDAPESYRGGLWMIPRPGAYAEWYGDTAEAMAELIRRIETAE
jgi:hypothetical protein